VVDLTFASVLPRMPSCHGSIMHMQMMLVMRMGMLMFQSCDAVYGCTSPPKALRVPVRSGGFAPVDPWAFALSFAAAAAIFRFNAGILQTSAACAVAGTALYAAGALQ
jgi:chromate transporter